LGASSFFSGSGGGIRNDCGREKRMVRWMREEEGKRTKGKEEEEGRENEPPAWYRFQDRSAPRVKWLLRNSYRRRSAKERGVSGRKKVRTRFVLLLSLPERRKDTLLLFPLDEKR